MTVMIDSFFGVHPAVVRSGFWAKMKPGEKDLYIYLLEESERHCNRELTRTDAQIHGVVGVATRTLCDARKRLGEVGLIQYRRDAGGKFVYTICNPVTCAPYPGDPKQRISYVKHTAEPTRANAVLVALAAPEVDAILAPPAPAPQPVPVSQSDVSPDPPRVCFMHGNRDVWYLPDGTGRCGICTPSPNPSETVLPSETIAAMAPKSPTSVSANPDMTAYGLRGVFD